MYISLKYLNIVMDLMSTRLLTVLKVILRFRKKWYSIYQKYFFCHKYIFLKFDRLSGNYDNVPCHAMKPRHHMELCKNYSHIGCFPKNLQKYNSSEQRCLIHTIISPLCITCTENYFLDRIKKSM